MGWTAIQNDWSSSFKTAIFQEYVDAINERLAALGLAPPLDDLVDGQDAAGATGLWAVWQSAASELALYFLASASEAGFVFFTYETWLTAAGIPNGFRRIPTSKTCLVSGVYDAEAGTTTITATGGTPFKAGHVGCKLSVLSPAWPGDYAIAGFTSSTVITITGQCPCTSKRFSVMPADWTDYDDPAFVYSTAADGDVIGPWLLADLQAAINVLWKTWHAVTGSAGTNNRRYGIGYSDFNFGETWADAVARAEAAYSDAGGLGNTGAFPVANYYGSEGASGDFLCIIERVTNSVFWSPATLSSKARDIDWYAKFAVAEGTTTPDGNGDFPGHTVGDWHLWLTDPGVTELQPVSSEAFGSLTMPNACAEPTYPNDLMRGYATTGYMGAVARWNVAGGFEYV